MKKKAEGVPIKSDDHAEEVRLAPKKVSKIAPNDNFDFDKNYKQLLIKTHINDNMDVLV